MICVEDEVERRRDWERDWGRRLLYLTLTKPKWSELDSRWVKMLQWMLADLRRETKARDSILRGQPDLRLVSERLSQLQTEKDALAFAVSLCPADVAEAVKRTIGETDRREQWRVQWLPKLDQARRYNGTDKAEWRRLADIAVTDLRQERNCREQFEREHPYFVNLAPDSCDALPTDESTIKAIETFLD